MLQKILVFEFITGGGFAQNELPGSLAEEGKLMLLTLVEQLAALACFQITVLLDCRCNQFKLPENVEIVTVSNNQSVFDLLSTLMTTVDYVWPVAPEIDNILTKISLLVENSKTRLLNSSSAAITICSDKLKTFEMLKQHGIAVVDTQQLDTYSENFSGLSVIKPKHGVGCLDSFLVSNEDQFELVKNQIEKPSDFVIQPYIKGKSMSLSCLFKETSAWFLCANQQQIRVIDGQFELIACKVNQPLNDQVFDYQLINQIAKIIPGLWGYVGIDFIFTENNELLILEINPRLTTSYTGIYQALGINVAALIIEMIGRDPVIKQSHNRSITLTLKQE